jgi:hypothetical protein
MEVALRSSRTRTAVPSRISRTIGSSANERAFHASQSLFTLRQTRLTVSLPTAPGGHRFPAAAFADDREGLAFLHIEGDPVDGAVDAVRGAEMGLQILDLEERHHTPVSLQPFGGARIERVRQERRRKKHDEGLHLPERAALRQCRDAGGGFHAARPDATGGPGPRASVRPDGGGGGVLSSALESVLRAANEDMAMLVPNARFFVAEDSGHDIHQDQPDGGVHVASASGMAAADRLPSDTRDR